MIQLSFKSEVQYANTRGLLFKAVFTGFYGVNGVGDLLNLAPYELGTNPGGVLDPDLKYNLILAQPTSDIGPFNQNIGGYYCNVRPPAAGMSLYNIGLQIYAPGGAELNSNAAYNAAVLAGYVLLMAFVPTLQ